MVEKMLLLIHLGQPKIPDSIFGTALRSCPYSKTDANQKTQSRSNKEGF